MLQIILQIAHIFVRNEILLHNMTHYILYLIKLLIFTFYTYQIGMKWFKTCC